MPSKKWLVFYTRSRQEKVAQKALEQFGFQGYLPMHKIMRQWSDRKKKVEVPLFNSYIFVFDQEYRIGNILDVPGISRILRYDGRPAYLREKELETIKRFIASGLTIEAHKIDNIKVGDKVEIIDGPMRGAVGVLTGEYSESRFSIILETINQVLTVSVAKELLRRKS